MCFLCNIFSHCIAYFHHEKQFLKHKSHYIVVGIERYIYISLGRLFRVDVKEQELEFGYYNKETLLFTISPYDGSPKPYIPHILILQ